MGPAPLRISRLERIRFLRLCTAAGVVACWLGLILADLLFSFMMFFSEPNTAEVALFTSPMLLAAPWIVAMANARGTVLVRPDELEIRHRRVLRRPLVIPRAQVQRVLLDDGRATGRARFATGDEHEPLLWTDMVVRRQRPDRPVIGDGILPNLAILLDPPVPMDAARDQITAVPASCEIGPPPRSGHAQALLLAMEDLDAVRQALSGWPVEQPDAARVVPAEVAAAAARVPADAGVYMALAVVGAILLSTQTFLLLPVWAVVSFFVVRSMIERRREAAERAHAEVDRRSSVMSPAERATARAAIDANFGPAPSQGPPGW